MSKTIKKVLSILLWAALLFGAAPLNGFVELNLPSLSSLFASVAHAASGTCGTNLTWNYDEETATLTISGTGTMNDYSTSNAITTAPWKTYYQTMQTVVINSGVTNIGEYAFYKCTGLTSVTIPDSVTSIGHDAFFDCTGLTSVTIPVSVTSIGAWAFYNCTGLTSVTIPDSVTSIGHDAFFDCTGLTSVTIGSSVESIGSDAFHMCTGLTSVTIPDSVTSIGDSAFYFIANVVYHGSASGSPWGARSVNGYIEAPLVYSDSTKTTLLACPSSNQGEITIPDSVTSIGRYAFYECTGLTSVTIPDSVTSIGSGAFFCVANIVYYGSASGSPWGARAANGYLEAPFVYADSTKTTLLACPSSNQGEITIPDSVTSIGDLAFHMCTGLTGVTIPNSVTSIGELAFYNCTGLTSVTIGNSVTSIGGSAFSSCTRLTSVTIPVGVTSISSYAFENCTGLTSVTIPDSVTSIDNDAFHNCTGLTSVTIPVSVTSIGAWAFYNCTGLTSVTIPDSVTSIGSLAFYGCTGLTDVYYVGTQANWNAISIGSYNDPLRNATLHLHQHNYVSSVTTEPTCSQEGVKTYTCYCGDSYTEPITKLPHTPAEAVHENVVDAACTEAGSYDEVVYCSVCNAELSRTTIAIPATGHHYDDGVVTKEPTCSQNGVRTYTCDTCGDTATESIAKLPHTPKTVTIPATCTANGKYYDICEVCGEKLSADTIIPATGHHYDDGVVTKEPTCSQNGVRTYTCGTCGDTYTESIPKLPHTPAEAVHENVIDAACTEAGSYDEVVYCSVCGAEISRTAVVVPATGHHYESAVTKQPTCTQEGVMTYTCSCGDSYTEPIEIVPHSPSDWLILRQPVACTSTGLRVKMCTSCGQTLEMEEIPIPHAFGEWTVVTPATCTADGEETRTCTDCGTTETRPVDAFGHDYVATVIAPTCVEAGFTTHVCSRCGDSYVTDLVHATGHTCSEWMMFVDPTNTSDGVMGRKCTVCGVVLDQTTVPKLAGDHVTGVTLSAEKAYLSRGETLTLTATVAPDTALNKNVTWTSTAPAVATVENGVVTAVAPGIAAIVAAAEDGGIKDFCLVQVNAVTPQNGSVISNGVITGLSINLNCLDDYLTPIDGSMTIETDGNVIGTGTKIIVKQGDTVINEFEAVIFGDIDGDSWYDGTDAYFVRLVANGMVSPNALTDSQRKACDVNHDGAINEADVALIEKAGLLLNQIDQTASQEELQTNGVYLEYCGLIDQSAEIVEPDQSTAADETPQPAAQAVWNRITTLFTVVLNWLLRVLGIA